jgi:hypothetical protein
MLRMPPQFGAALWRCVTAAAAPVVAGCRLPPAKPRRVVVRKTRSSWTRVFVVGRHGDGGAAWPGREWLLPAGAAAAAAWARPERHARLAAAGSSRGAAPAPAPSCASLLLQCFSLGQHAVRRVPAPRQAVLRRAV